MAQREVWEGEDGRKQSERMQCERAGCCEKWRRAKTPGAVAQKHTHVWISRGNTRVGGEGGERRGGGRGDRAPTRTEKKRISQAGRRGLVLLEARGSEVVAREGRVEGSVGACVRGVGEGLGEGWGGCWTAQRLCDGLSEL